MYKTSELCFEIAGVSFRYKYNSAIAVEDDWPVRCFLAEKDKYDIVNDITFDSRYDDSWTESLVPEVVLPGYAIYIRQGKPTVVFQPDTPSPVAVVTLENGFQRVSTQVINDSYTKQPLPLCVMGFLLQGILAEQNSGFIMHGAAWADEAKQKGLLFTGNSGVGKSTISRIFRENTRYGQISDDRVIIKYDADGFYACGNPFDYKINRISNERVKLYNLYFLHHSPENKVVPIEDSAKIKRLLTITLLPYWNKRQIQSSSLLLAKLPQQIKMYDLFFKPDPDVIPCVLEAL